MGLKILYDDECEFCTFVKDIAEKYDDSGSLIFVPAGSSSFSPDGVPSEYPDRIATVDESGMRTSDGIDTLIRISRKVTAFFPLYPLLVFLKFIGAGQASYDIFAGKRYAISRFLRYFIH